MPDQLRHPTTRGMPATPYHSGNSIPLDEESGLPKTFAHSASSNGGGHPDSYGGWEDDDEYDEGELEASEQARLTNGKARDSFDTPSVGDIDGSGRYR